MSGRVFFDTNILVYAFGGKSMNDPRIDAAERLVALGGVVSVQVLNEFTQPS
jgi:predicted nucleic acid-binding protein